MVVLYLNVARRGAHLAAERGSARALAGERGAAKWRGRGLGRRNTKM